MAKENRLAMGRVREDALFPTALPKAGLPADYASVLARIKGHIVRKRLRTVQAANSVLVQLYWDIGRMILERQRRAGWGARIIDRLARDLSSAFPDMKGFSPRNLMFMRGFAVECPNKAIVKQLVSLLPWGHIVRLFQRVKEQKARDWYIRRCIEQGWSRSVLEMQIDRRGHERQGKAISNFDNTLPPVESDMASQIFKDPYLFDFLGTADPRREQEVERALVDHIQRFLLELGAGFAFVGRQVPLEIGGQDFRMDLLFYHLKLRCYVVVELKAVPFDPAFVGQINLYLSAVDDLLRHPEDKPTIGLVLCQSKNKIIVEYALRHLKRPVGVAQWETKMVESLPAKLRASLPTVAQIEKEMSGSGKGLKSGLKKRPQS